MIFLDIKNILTEHFGQETFPKFNDAAIQPEVTVLSEKIAQVCTFLKNDPRLFFDQLSCLTAIDNGPEANTMEVVYHLNSIVFEHTIVLKINILREELPKVPSVSHVWRTADWHEREAYDLVGIYFENHPDLRRILMPADWQGHPLRKDYQTQEVYHGIKVDY